MTTPRTIRRRERRRQQLIDAARQIITAKGIAALTVQDVTEAADMAVGSFYTYFPSKEALLEAAIWEPLQQLGDPDDPALQALPLAERRQRQLQRTFAFVETHRDLMAAVFGPGGLPEQFDRGMDLLESRIAAGLERTTSLPSEVIAWIAPLVGGMIAGGIRYLLAHPEVSAAEMTQRTALVLRPLEQYLAPGASSEAGNDA